MRLKNKMTLLSAAAAGALLLSACGGGGLAGDASSDADESGPILLGMLAPSSGSEAAFGEYMQNGAQLAINEINEAGGVNGRELKLQFEDDACDPETATAGANKLVTAGIDASIGGYCSGATLPTLSIFTDNGIPMVIPAANSNQLPAQNIDGVYLINGIGEQQAEAGLKYAEKSGASKVALIHDNDDYAKDLASSFEAQHGEGDFSFEIVMHEGLTKGESDYSAVVNNLLRSEADFLYFTGYYQEGGLLVRQAKQAGFDGEILVGDGTVDAAFAETAGIDYALGVKGTFTQSPDMLESAQDWVDAYKELSGGDEPGPYATQSYDAVRVIATAIEDAGTTEMGAVIEALDAIDGLELFSGPLKFTENGTLDGGGFRILEVDDTGIFVLHDLLQD